MKVVIKKAGQKGKIAEISNTLEALQEVVGGYIECVPIGSDAVIICNEEGKMYQMPENVLYHNDIIVGDIIFCGTDKEEFCDIPQSAIEYLYECEIIEEEAKE